MTSLRKQQNSSLCSIGNKAAGEISHFTLANPPDNDVYNVYRWLFCKFYPGQGKEIFGDEAERSLEQYTEKALLTRLKEWLFKKQKQHLKEK